MKEVLVLLEQINCFFSKKHGCSLKKESLEKKWHHSMNKLKKKILIMKKNLKISQCGFPKNVEKFNKPCGKFTDLSKKKLR